MTESEFEKAVELAEKCKNEVGITLGEMMDDLPDHSGHKRPTDAAILARALLHARDAALEEAANCCNTWADRDAIRSLKSNQSKAPEGGGKK